MIKSGKSYLDICIPSDDFQKRKQIEALLQENYHADFDLYQHVRPMFISLRNNESLRLPKVNLSSYLRQIESGVVKPDVLPFDVTIRFVHLGKMDRNEDLNQVLNDFQGNHSLTKGQYYCERVNEKVLLMHFWTQDVAERAAKRLKKQVGNFNHFVLDVNYKLQQDEKKTQDTILQVQMVQQDIKKQLKN